MIGILVPSLALALSCAEPEFCDYTRTPDGYSITSPVSVDVSMTEAFKTYCGVGKNNWWIKILDLGGQTGYDGVECYDLNETMTMTSIIALPVGEYESIEVHCAEVCFQFPTEFAFVEIDGGENPLFEIVEEPSPPTPIIPLPTGFTTSILANVGELFTDLSSLVGLTIGLPVGFWGIKKVISLAKFR